ncbi:MAG: molybdopterin molybdotransferase MoeA [Fimbriimonadaceae bacterium]|nr:molybdopterin molybdotransferase MoeA [Fimbriimonadaceae bacterium]
MITVDEALSIIRDLRPCFPTERMELIHALGRVVAKDVVSPFDLPLFDNSAMDGFAVGSPEGPWEIVGEVAAGATAPGGIQPCQAVRIFTGAPVPTRTYGIIAQEDASEQDGLLVGEVRKGAHVRFQAEEAPAGHLVAQKGATLTPPHLAAFASCGLATVEVRGLPNVIILSTGNEVVPPGQSLQYGQIFNSNATALASALALRGIRAQVRHAPDSQEELRAQIHESIQSSELLITTGGVSVGAHDLVRATMEEAGFHLKFHGVAVKPGKPIAFGTREDGKVWCGLPGNPLSTWVGYLVFVSAWLGDEFQCESRQIAKTMDRKPGREEFLPAKQLPGGEITILNVIGSHANFGLLESDGLVRINRDVITLAQGEHIDFLPFPWSRNP